MLVFERAAAIASCAIFWAVGKKQNSSFPQQIGQFQVLVSSIIIPLKYCSGQLSLEIICWTHSMYLVALFTWFYLILTL